MCKLSVKDAVYGDLIALSPAFDGKSYLNYKATVTNAVYSVAIFPEPADVNDTIKATINGVEVSEADWNNLPLREGKNLLEVGVTDANGEKITQAEELAIIEGYPDGSFRPDEQSLALRWQ